MAAPFLRMNTDVLAREGAYRRYPLLTFPSDPDLLLELTPEPSAPAFAREAIRDRFSDRMPAPFLHDLLVVVSELIGNSVEHGPGAPIKLRLEQAQDGSVRGEVEDEGDGEVAIREMRDDGADGGLGLRIVEALTDRWAVYEGSTHVWFEMRPQPA